MQVQCAQSLESRLLLTVFTVQNLKDSGAGSLRAAVAASQSGDTIQFAKKLSGTLTLTTGQIDITHDLVIQGTSAGRIKISGDDASRIFRVTDLDTTDAEVPDLAVSNVSLIRGYASSDAATMGQAAGGAIAFLASGGSLTLTGVTLADNRAVGEIGTDAAGGAIFFLAGNSKSVNLVNCLVSGNRALGGTSGGFALGGAVTALSADGTATSHFGVITEGSNFRSNRAIGGDGGTERTSQFLASNVGQVGAAMGGAIAVVGVRSFLEATTFDSNVAQAGSGGASDLSGPPFSYSFVATAAGGAVAGVSSGNISRQLIQRSTFRGNAAIGGSNAAGIAPGSIDMYSHVGSGLGGAQFTFGSPATIADSHFSSNRATGGDDNAADAGGSVSPMVSNGRGGAVYLGGYGAQLLITDTLIEDNFAEGGSGGTTSPHTAGMVSYGPVNAAAGGGVQSDSLDSSRMTIAKTIIRNNQARGGRGGDGPDAGAAYGGGVGRLGGGFTVLDSVTIMSNAAIAADGTEGVGSEAGADAFGGGIYSPQDDNITMASKLVGNRAVGGTGAGTGDGGSATGGGGFLAGEISDTEIEGNTAINGGVSGLGSLGTSFGGGLMTRGNTRLVRSSVTSNTAMYGGGLYNSNGALVLANTTVGANTAHMTGGGIYLGHLDATYYSTLTLTSVTIARNTAHFPAELGDAGSAVYTNYSGNSTTIRNSIVAENTRSDWGGVMTGIGYAITGDYNFWDDSSVGDGGLNSIVKTAAVEGHILLGELGYYGGMTKTFPLLPGSLAIDSGEANALTSDQRGIFRPQNIRFDRGAFESQGFQINIVSGNRQTVLTGRRFARPLVVKVSANNPLEPIEGGIVLFTPPASGASATLSPSKTMTIGRSKRVSVIATANLIKGTYTVRAAGAGFAIPSEFTLTNR